MSNKVLGGSAHRASAPPPQPPWMRISLARQDLLEEEGWPHLLKEKGQETVPQWAFIGFNLHRNTRHIHKAHQSFSGSNDQTIDNIQRTMRAYSEQGQIAKGP